MPVCEPQTLEEMAWHRLQKGKEIKNTHFS